MARFRPPLKRLVLTKRARRDLHTIWEYIARVNEAAAGRTVASIRDHFELLRQRPNAGRTREDVAPGYRSFPVGEYLIFYRTDPVRVTVVRVLHGRRDLPNLLH